MLPSTIVAVAPTKPSIMVFLVARQNSRVAKHGAIVLERQHVPAVEAEELEERADRELADRQQRR